MHTLEQLRSGQLRQHTRINIKDNLEQLPEDFAEYCPLVEVLDLSDNQLRALPESLSQLQNLRIVFASNNQFEVLPEVLGRCKNLDMIGFKSNQIREVSAAALPVKLRWLILTDNQIESLPEQLGECSELQKCALAGNRLTALPQSMKQCRNLELLRVSANCLNSFPTQLLELPRLAWLAFAGNPFCQAFEHGSGLAKFSLDDFVVDKVLGQGASGVISLAHPKSDVDLPSSVAIKVFKGEVTSDGYPSDELDACLHVDQHPALVNFMGQIDQADCSAVVMKLIPEHFSNLGQPPSLASCTRDTFLPEQQLGIEAIAKIVEQMQSLLSHLREHHMCHGDLYAHNVLVDEQHNIVLGDFGAASHYEYLSQEVQAKLIRVEQRALAFFIEDMLSICQASEQSSNTYQQLNQLASKLLEA
ncbi:leucine-rich repeat-containing protein kinase family protein [Agarivorans sp. Alg241-V36]|uniref:leucine-rich repeat-containing protein kinase family protein n=1 Tax=Agarivorans sp. Alg241-V36 TaxID=2305992 RepID=UPI0013D79459|nr:leucine-rich repeat-containing protein kinase family protein [Agarivorans sp. Alg241-V36]